MSDAISVECPQCHARLKLKSRSAVGKKVPCPKCKQPFVVSAPAEEDDMAFLNVAEPEPDEFGPVEDAEEMDDLPPAAPTSRGKSRGKKKSSAANGEMTTWLLIGCAAIAVIGITVGGAIWGVPLLSAWLTTGNKIDTAYLPPEADFVMHARVDEAWNAPFVQSLVSMQTIKPQLDTTWAHLGITPSEIRTITVGGTGIAQIIKAGAARGGPGIPGLPVNPMAGVPSGQNGFQQMVVVVRTKAPDGLSKIRDKFKNGRTMTHQGMEYLIPPVGGDTALYFATGDTLVTGTEQNVKQAIEWGRTGTRRPDLDFVDPSHMVLIAVVPKDPSTFDVPVRGGGSPAGGTPPLNEAMRGKVKGFCLGLSATDKIDFSMATNCTDHVAASSVQRAVEQSLSDTKAQFAKLKPTFPPMISEFVQLADDVLNSLQVSSSGDVVAARGALPANLKSTLEKLPMLMMGMMMQGGGPGGLPGNAPFGGPGAPGAQGFPMPGGQPAGGIPPGQQPAGNPSLGGNGAGGFGTGPQPGGTTPANGVAPGFQPPGQQR